MRFHLAAISIAFALVGCMPGDPESNDTSDAGRPPADQSQAYIQAQAAYWCDYFERCWYPNDDFVVLRFFVDTAEQDCRAHFERIASSDFDTFAREPLEAGAIFDAGAMTRCAAESLRTCLPISQLPGCDDIIKGVVAEGEPCTGSHRCAPGLTCSGDNADDDACGRTGQPETPPDPQCRNGFFCQDGADGSARFCLRPEDNAPMGVCTPYTFRPTDVPGDPCGLIETDGGWVMGTCTGETYCSSGTRTTEAGVCTRPAALGEPCNDLDLPCAGGLCLGGVCRVPDGSLGLFRDCDPGPGFLCNPVDGRACRNGGCVAADGREGDPCGESEFEVPCRSGLHCDRDTATCVARRADGEACEADNGYGVCLSHHCPRPEDGGDAVCAPDPRRVICI